MDDKRDNTVNFEEKLRDKLNKELKPNTDFLTDDVIDFILNVYSDGLSVFYEDGVKKLFEKSIKTNDRNIRAVIGILDAQRETITNLNKKIKNQEERITKLEEKLK